MPNRLIPTVLLTPALGFALIAPVQAQESDDDWCYDRDRGRVVCELREFTFAPDGDLRIDGGMNGGISVTGWDRDEVRVEARVRARARNAEAAAALAEDIRVRADEDRIDSDGPSRLGGRESWSVSYRVYTPYASDLDLDTHNGGIVIKDVSGDLRFSAMNGGVAVSGASGRVEGHTTNGGVTIQLTGDRWEGDGLDVETTNGGVVIAIPADYSAELETGTVNGGLDLEVPLTVQGRLGRQLRSTLGDGGPRVRVTTTNGGVKVVRGGLR